MNGQRLTHIFSALGCAVFGIILLFFSFKYILPAALPFIIAWGIAFLVRPIAKRLSSVLRIPAKPVRVILALLVLFGIGTLAVYLVLKVGAELIDFFSGIENNEKIMGLISVILNPTLGKIGDGEIFAELEKRLSLAMSEMISSLISGVSTLVTAFVGRIPGIFIFLVTLVIASVYFSFDLEAINSAVRRLLPKKLQSRALDFKEKTLSVLLRYLRSYLILMLITFAIVLVGLLVLRVKYSLLLALIIAALDLLPVIGVGTVLVPWSVYCFLAGNTPMGIGLTVLFVIMTLLRNFIEPKLVGKSLGIHPLLTLVMLYAGYSFLGLTGLILMPAVAVAINSLFAKDKSSEVEHTVTDG